MGTGGWREVEGFKSNLEVTISRTLINWLWEGGEREKSQVSGLDDWVGAI